MLIIIIVSHIYLSNSLIVPLCIKGLIVINLGLKVKSPPNCHLKFSAHFLYF
ncbi:hypothetical protein Lalb_Chr04g0252551 [Lupinus albus]|uniref:Uncharacterized protein n=1 Tax=Lupinus albus TaxID=3870 RepID=A0A6A4QNG4_LUPAL|nr:hypothetical protein Lalb_Chr04g0252551 [Lupinus albus]